MELNLEGIWVTQKSWHSVKWKRRGRKWYVELNHLPCVASCLSQTKSSAVMWMFWFFLYVLQVWLLHLLEYASSTLLDLLVFPRLRIFMVVICSQRCSFLPLHVIRTPHLPVILHSGMCPTMCEVLALTVVSQALSLRFAMNLPNVDSFVKEGFPNWTSCIQGLKKMQVTSICNTL